MEQQTVDWLKFRRKKIGSSDAAIILGISPWSTPYKLWCEKLSDKEPQQLTNFVIDRGNRWEPKARARYELQTGLELPPVVKVSAEHDFLIASLDGYSAEHDIVLEIKCLTGKETFNKAKAGVVVDHYYAQLQHQLLVTRAKEAHFFCCLIDVVNGQEQIIDEALVVVPPDEKFQKEMLMHLIGFYKMMNEKIKPQLTNKDCIEIDDQSSVIIFSKIKRIKDEFERKQKLFKRLKQDVDNLELDLADLKQEAIEHVQATYNHTKVACCNVKMTKTKAGVWMFAMSNDEAA